MKARISVFLFVLGAACVAAGSFSSLVNSRQSTTWPVTDFPIEMHTWDSIGPLMNYDWGLSAYIYLHDGNFYYMILGGSEFYAIWISLDPNHSGGFQVNGLSVDYVLSTVGPEDRTSLGAGLHEWIASEEEWQPLAMANMTEDSQSGIIRRSGDGSVAFSANQGKVALSKIGNPDRVWLVLEANEVGPLRVPQNGFAYLDVANDFAAVFMVHKEIGPIAHPGTAFPREPQSWVINRFEIASATVCLKNYGTTQIQNAQVDLIVPPEITVLDGTPVWSTSIAPEQNETHAIQINRTSFGTSTLNTSFTYVVGESKAVGPIILHQKLTMIPRVSLNITTPQETLLLMQRYRVDLTIANLDLYPATVDVRPLAYGEEHDVIALTLNPVTNITLHPEAKIAGNSIGYAVFFEGIELASATAPVSFTYPGIWINQVLIDDEPYNLGQIDMETTEMHTVQATIQNEETASYSVTVILTEGPYWQWQELSPVDTSFAPYHSTQAVELPPNSTKTITFHIYALNQPATPDYTSLTLALEIGQTYLHSTEVSIKLTSQPSPFLTPEIILISALMFFIGIVAKITYDVISRRRG